jgi:hypothetical protein
MTFLELAGIFGLSNNQAVVLDGYCVLKINPKNVVIEDKYGEELSIANVTMGVLSMAQTGKIGPATKSMIKGELESAFDKAWGMVPDKDNKYPYVDTPTHDEVQKTALSWMIKGDKVKAIKAVRTMTGLGLKAAKSLCDDWWDAHEQTAHAKASAILDDIEAEEAMEAEHFYPKKKKKKKVSGKPYGETEFAGAVKKAKVMPKGVYVSNDTEGVMSNVAVPLAKAKEIFQPVGGTDSTSVYFAIAIGPEVNVGCRVTSAGKISIRAEGPGCGKNAVTKQLAAAGLSSASAGHWSVHLNVPDESLTKKTIGAVLFALSLPFTQIAGDVSPIMGKGS